MVELVPLANAERLDYLAMLAKATTEAQKSKCLCRRVGAVVVEEYTNRVLGRGANYPPRWKKPETCNKLTIPKIGGPNDRHCCLHAEQNAIVDAIAHHPLRDMQGATLFFADIDLEGNIVACASKPYCTQCSKFAYHWGIGHWVCFHALGVWRAGPGWYRYTAEEYNDLSFQYRDDAMKVCDGRVEEDGNVRDHFNNAIST